MKEKDAIQAQSEIKDGQSTLDKHLIPSGKTTNPQLEDTLNAFSEKLSKLASQEYLESRFKQMITEEFLSKKLKELEKEVKSQVKKEIEKVHKQVGELKGRVETAEEEVVTLRNKVSDIESSIEKMSAENIQIKDENKKIKEQLVEREAKLKAMSEDINNLEQYTRKNSVRIYGVNDRDQKETPMETARQVSKLLKDKLQLTISTADIGIAHRMGRFKNDANRPIICKFVSRITKQEVIKARRMLKGTPVVIREDLTLQNAKLLERTTTLDSVRAAWSDDGKVIALLNNGKKVVVDGKTDLSRI